MFRAYIVVVCSGRGFCANKQMINCASCMYVVNLKISKLGSFKL